MILKAVVINLVFFDGSDRGESLHLLGKPNSWTHFCMCRNYCETRLSSSGVNHSILLYKSFSLFSVLFLFPLPRKMTSTCKGLLEQWGKCSLWLRADWNFKVFVFLVPWLYEHNWNCFKMQWYYATVQQVVLNHTSCFVTLVQRFLLWCFCL